MVGEGVYPVAPIEKAPSLPGGAWRTGTKLTISVPQPLLYELDSKRLGELKALYYEESIPIMRDDLVEALVAAGVDNLELFDAVVYDPENQKEYTNYKAFNIVGLVAAADSDASTLMGTSDSELLDVDYDGLVIDEELAAPYLLFRLAENVSAIIVEEKVKKSIEDNGIPGIIFYGPGEWSG
jgi:hypothetical protein